MTRIRLRVLLLVLLIAAAAASIQPVRSEPAQPPQRPARDVYTPGGEPWLTRLPPAAAQPAGTAPAWTAPGLSGLTAWSRIVFQSARDRNWNIFITSGPGTEQHILTRGSEADAYPRLNRGATRVAFSSNRNGNYDIFVMSAEGWDLVQLTTDTRNDYDPVWSPDGSRIAFSSLRDGQSEIYVMNVDGAGQRRLTFDAAYDGQPAWSADGAQIAFVSARGGNDGRIWVMNADGNNQRRLSNQPYSQHPAWSPNGTTIAYDSDGNGDDWQELWLMNADGTNQRLGYDPSEPQTDAWVRSWSPDGRFVAFTRISFILYQGNWYWLAAYLDGKEIAGNYDAIVRLSDTGEDWYPDWQSSDLLAPVTRVNALPAQSPGPFHVTWSGWDPGTAGVNSYDVQVSDSYDAQFPDREWINWQVQTQATAADFPGVGGRTYRFRARARDNAGNLEPWPASAQASTTVESIPPLASMLAVPSFARNPVTVRWTGSDGGGSGITSYEVEVRDRDGAGWQGLMTTPDTWGSFSGEPGHSYSFRVRATDRALNTGAWSSEDAGPWTTIYGARVEGTVTDGRGVHVPGVTVNFAPAALKPVTSTAAGLYAAYLPPADAYTMTLHGAGFQSTPPLSLLGSSDWVVDPVLLPLDSVLRGGGFEQDGAVPGAWSVGGSITPTITTALRHSGSDAALMGCSEFAPPLALSVNQPVAHSPQIVVDQNRNVHAVWSAGEWDYDRHVWYARRDASGGWASPENPWQTWEPSDAPALAVDQGGIVHLVWTSAGRIMYVQRSLAGVWSDPVQVQGERYGGPAQVGVDNAGNVHVLWTTDPAGVGGGGIYDARRTPDGTWAAPRTLVDPIAWSYDVVFQANGAIDLVWAKSSGEAGADIYYQRLFADGRVDGPYNVSHSADSSDGGPRLVVDSAGIVHLLWAGSGQAGNRFFYARRAPGAAWSAPLIIGQGDTTRYLARADASGALHVIIGADYLRRSADGAWSEAVAVDAGSGAASGLGLTDPRPDMAVEPDGTMHVIWQAETGIFYRRRLADGAWLPVVSFGEGMDPRLALSQDGVPHVVWLESSTGLYRVAYGGPQTVSRSGGSTILQAVSVPLTLTNPTLSFLYQLQRVAPLRDAWLDVSVNNGSGPATVYSTTTRTGGWTLRWADMSPWAGQTISVAFALQQTAGRTCAWAALDDVSLGSWLTPLPQRVTPGLLDVQTSAVITITGQNFMAPGPQVRLGPVVLTDTHWIDSTTITASIPGLGFGIYDLVVTNPGGQAGGLARALTTGKRVYLPLIVSGR